MPADRLRFELANVRFPLDASTEREIRRCVDAYVDAKKAENWPPERVLVDLKRIAADASLSTSALPTADSRESRAHLLMDLVVWSIERYYVPEPPR